MKRKKKKKRQVEVKRKGEKSRIIRGNKEVGKDDKIKRNIGRGEMRRKERKEK